MCFVYSATIYLRCRQCEAVDFTSARTIHSMTLCNAEVQEMCPRGLQPLESQWNQTESDGRLCQNCERTIHARQQRTIDSFQRLRPRIHHVTDRVSGSHTEEGTQGTVQNLRLENMVVGGPSMQTIQGDVRQGRAPFIGHNQTQLAQTLHNQQPFMDQPGHQTAALQHSLLDNFDGLAMPQELPDVDFENLFGEDAAFPEPFDTSGVKSELHDNGITLENWLDGVVETQATQVASPSR